MNAITPISYVNFNAHSSRTVHRTSRKPITIKNFHNVDETLMRGAKPTYEQLKELKSNGVKTIVSFCTNYNPVTQKTGDIPVEAEWAKKLGMNFYWIPFKSTENPSDRDVEAFFSIMDNARNNGEKVFIHCRHGADRTGLFSSLYRIKYQNAELSQVIRELMAYGHDANNNPNIIPYIIDFHEENSGGFFKKLFRNLFKIN